MKILMVYDTMFGNTERIAQAMVDATGDQHQAELVRVQDVTIEQLQACDILVIGSPTHGFRPTPDISSRLKRLSSEVPAANFRYAVFDTRSDIDQIESKILSSMVRLFGYAAESMDKTMARRGFKRAEAPVGFIVHGKEGPLKDGEIDRATAWMRSVMEN
ncbi:MAG: flavodoxin family protein [Spirochaetia bacterium]|nr:flavodoxin family protein [Spirochaetia bacterium]